MPPRCPGAPAPPETPLAVRQQSLQCLEGRVLPNSLAGLTEAGRPTAHLLCCCPPAPAAAIGCSGKCESCEHLAIAKAPVQHRPLAAASAHRRLRIASQHITCKHSGQDSCSQCIRLLPERCPPAAWLGSAVSHSRCAQALACGVQPPSIVLVSQGGDQVWRRAWFMAVTTTAS